jgi:integrase
MPSKQTSKARTRRGFGRIRKRASGRWQAGYRYQGVFHNAPATFHSKDAAVAWAAEEQRLIDLKVWTPPAKRVAKAQGSRTTFREYANRWLEHRNVAPRTRENYRWHLDDNIFPTLGDKPITELTPDDVREWFAELGDERRTRNAQAYGVLTAVLNTAVDDGLIDRSPARIKGAAKVKHAARSVVLLEPGELAELADKMTPELRLSVLLAGWCGLRRGEVFALTREDITADCSTVRVNKGVVMVNRRCQLSPPKTQESNRTVTVPLHVREALAEHLDRHVGKPKSALLFPDPVTGGFHTEGRFRGPFRAAKAAIGHPDLHFHDLRHFGGVMAAHAGATTKEVMSRLGHTSAGTAMRYQHIAKGREDALAERLSALA